MIYKAKEFHLQIRKRAEWPSGGWDDEPDRVEWVDAATGLQCVAQRHATFGFWCGYVGLPDGHPVTKYIVLDTNSEPLASVHVHGGVTYADYHLPVMTEGTMVPECWVGFDCGHWGDMSPMDVKNHSDYDNRYGGVVYRTLGYVQHECSNLAHQLHELRHKTPLLTHNKPEDDAHDDFVKRISHY